MRISYQNGSVIRVSQKSGDHWRLRYRQDGAQRSEYIGSVSLYPSKAAATKAAARMMKIINGPALEVITISDLIEKFWREAAPKREATARSYRSIFRRVEEQFGSLRVDKFCEDMPAVEEWLKGLKVISRKTGHETAKHVSSSYAGQVRNLLHLLIEKAMLWRHVSVDRNPVELIRLNATTKRQREATIITPGQYQALLADPLLPGYMKAMIQVTASLGLRISEVLALRWTDIDFDKATISINRSFAAGEANATKTATSRQVLPLHETVAKVLSDWKTAKPSVNGWVFGSERTGKPFDRDNARAEHLKPAGERIGVKNLGFHSLRHSYRAIQKQLGLSLETQRAMMRHAKIATTVDVYGGEDNLSITRPANAQVIEFLQGGM